MMSASPRRERSASPRARDSSPAARRDRSRSRERDAPKLGPGNRLFIGDLSFSSTDGSLKDYFEKWGNVQEARVIVDRSSGRSKGFGFVTFEEKDDAAKAVERANDTELDGRTIKVEIAQEKRKFEPRSRGGYDRRDDRRSYDDRRGGDRYRSDDRYSRDRRDSRDDRRSDRYDRDDRR